MRNILEKTFILAICAYFAAAFVPPPSLTLALPSTDGDLFPSGRRPLKRHARLDEKEYLQQIGKDLKDDRAYPQQTPHSGRHFLPSHPLYQSQSSGIKALLKRICNPLRRPSRRKMKKRFMEGWYYRVTIPEEDVSFAFIFSVEDPGRSSKNGSEGSDLKLAACQVMGPNDEYMVQADRDDEKFWAWENLQGLGCTFEWDENHQESGTYKQGDIAAMHPDEWNVLVKTGFQMLPHRLLGRIEGHDGSLGGVLPGQGIKKSCAFDLTVTPLSGWGDDEDIECRERTRPQQKSTAGWLASFSVFEPHWQVTMADGRASGSVTWNGKQFNFTNAPFYAEKNWGGAFPSKWYWVQCNSFDGYIQENGDTKLSVTAGGGTRKVPFGMEDLGMVSVHYNGTFYEAVPWTGEMKWDCQPWGYWSFSARCTTGKRLFETELVATCDEEGVVLRAPTKDSGLTYFCRDSFRGIVELSLYELVWDESKDDFVRGHVIIDRASSKQAAVEIGGGPWWEPWRATSNMKQPLKGLVKIPYVLF